VLSLTETVSVCPPPPLVDICHRCGVVEAQVDISRWILAGGNFRFLVKAWIAKYAALSSSTLICCCDSSGLQRPPMEVVSAVSPPPSPKWMRRCG
jgi:hypothetical protein